MSYEFTVCTFCGGPVFGVSCRCVEFPDGGDAVDLAVEPRIRVVGTPRPDSRPRMTVTITWPEAA